MDIGNISPNVQPQFQTLSPDLQAAILEKNVKIHTLYDLIGVLEDLVAESGE